MLMNGTATTTCRRLWRRAWRRANAIAERVLPPPVGDRKPEQAGRTVGGVQTLLVERVAGDADGIGALAGMGALMVFEALPQRGERAAGRTQGGLSGIAVVFGVKEIGVDQRRKEHTHEELCVETILLDVARQGDGRRRFEGVDKVFRAVDRVVRRRVSRVGQPRFQGGRAFEAAVMALDQQREHAEMREGDMRSRRFVIEFAAGGIGIGGTGDQVVLKRGIAFADVVP